MSKIGSDITRQKTLFGPRRWGYLQRTVKVSSVPEARYATQQLWRMFVEAKSRKKKLKILRATVMAKNIAGAMLKRKGLSASEKQEVYGVIHEYYSTVEQMKKRYNKQYYGD